MRTMRISLALTSRPRARINFAMAFLILLAATACNPESPLPLEGPDRHALGPADASVTLVAFDDYQ